MPEMYREIIDDRSAWRGEDLDLSTDWVLELTPEQLEEMDRGARALTSRGLAVPDFGAPEWGRGDFPLESFADMADHINQELEQGRGFVLLKGLPAGEYSDDELATIYWAIGLQLGEPVSQSVKGDFLGHVRDEGGHVLKGHYRGFKGSKASPFHSDNCDVAGLLCVRPAKVGGLSGVASGAQIHNDLLQEHPDLLETLYEPFYADWRGEEPKGWAPYFTCPAYSYFDGRLSIRGGVTRIYTAQKNYPEIPRLTEQQSAALDALQESATRNQFTFGLEPGDIFLFNNYAVLHSRTAYEDYEEPHRRRHLMRLWLAVPDARALAPDFSTRYGEDLAGVPRGGIRPRGVAV